MPKLLTAEQIAPELLNNFLRRVYPPLKAEFLIQHGAWWHGSNANRLVIIEEDKVAGYCGVIPAQVWVAGQVRSALWWVDLVIAPELRGRGLQSLFDERIKQMSPLLLGFPNEVAAKIHRKHGWGVRDDMPIDLLPLWPRDVKMVRSGGLVRRIGALALSPLAAFWRAWLMRQNPRRAWRLPAFDPQALADVFERAPRNGLNTAWREASWFAWRYGQAPNRHEYAFYLAGKPESPSHFLVARFITQPDGLRYARILDVFGDFADTPALSDLFTLALQDCIRHRAGQVTLIASRPELHTLARRLGFLFSAPVGFCWLSDDPALMQALSAENYWALVDSDNDAPD
jgi:hypothetical protein